MTLVQLSYIVAVDNYRSFAEAAKNCFVTQPTLSMQIQKLENELGLKVFDRGKHPIMPTPFGTKIIDQARVVLKENARLLEMVDEEMKRVQGVFRLGIIPTIAPYLLPLFIEEFIKKHEGVELVFDELQTDQIVEKLKKDQLDAGILATPLNDKDIVEDPLYYEPFVGYVSENHPLYCCKKIDSAELELDNLWLLKEGHCFRNHVLQICKQYRSEDEFEHNTLSFEGGTLETLKKLVEKNFGMTLLPFLSISEMEGTDKMKHIREFKEPVPRREISIVYHKTHIKKQVIKALQREIQMVIPKDMQDKKNSYVLEAELI